MIEELKRCPAELFGLLSPADQQRFRTVVTEEGEDVEVLQKRFGDRFPHLAIRYLEPTGGLPGVQFYVDVGKFNFGIYEKEVERELRLRQLQRRRKGFGHLDDFAEGKMSAQWKALVKSSHELQQGFTEPHIVRAYPQYHFVNNAVGITFSKEPSHPLRCTGFYGQKT